MLRVDVCCESWFLGRFLRRDFRRECLRKIRLNHYDLFEIRSTLSTVMTEPMLAVNFTKLNPEAHVPTQGSPHAAGWDLRAVEETVIHKGKSTKILTGLAMAIPRGWEGQIRSRSSLGAKGLIMPNGVGTIDSDYRGEIMVLSTWIGEGDSFTVGKGERIAQMIFAPVPRVSFQETTPDKLGETERGTGGFGSSGRW